MDIEQALQGIREIYVNAPKRLEHREEELKKIQQEIQDFLHILELSNFNASQGYKYAKEIQRLQRERRTIKDEIEELKIGVEILSFHKPTEKILNRSIGDLRNAKQKRETRTYKMKVRDDLQELVL